MFNVSLLWPILGFAVALCCEVSILGLLMHCLLGCQLSVCCCIVVWGVFLGLVFVCLEKCQIGFVDCLVEYQFRV